MYGLGFPRSFVGWVTPLRSTTAVQGAFGVRMVTVNAVMDAEGVTAWPVTRTRSPSCREEADATCDPER